MLLPLFGGWSGQFDKFGHFEPDFFFNDFAQGNICGSQISNFRYQWTTQAASTGIELSDSTRNEVDQNVGVTNFLQSFFGKFGVQSVKCKTELERIAPLDTKAISK